ncbi:hypothetical protein AAHB53_24965 [Niallia circulans]
MMKNNHAWSNIEQAKFLKCIGELLDRGYSMAEAVQSSRYYMPDRRLEDINACYGSLKGGESFFENLVRFNFDYQVISFVYFAERHGGFASAFQDASRMIQNKQDTIRKLKKSLPILFFFCVLPSFYFSLFKVSSSRSLILSF